MLIQKGDRSDAVHKLRCFLAMKGYEGVDCNRTDFNEFVVRAVMKYQSDNSLEVDGMIGQNTLTAMKADGLTLSSFDLLPANGTLKAVNTVLQPSTGIATYNREKEGADQIGLLKTIQAIGKLGELWTGLYPSYPKIQIGDISRKYGGYFRGHGTHRRGNDVDMRPIRKDNEMLPTYCQDRRFGITYAHESYSQDRTSRLIDCMLQVKPDSDIFFNDVDLVERFRGKVRAVKEHHHHLHWNLPY